MNNINFLVYVRDNANFITIFDIELFETFLYKFSVVLIEVSTKLLKVLSSCIIFIFLLMFGGCLLDQIGNKNKKDIILTIILFIALFLAFDIIADLFIFGKMLFIIVFYFISQGF